MSKISNREPKPYKSDKFVQQWLTGLSEKTKQNYLEEIAARLDFFGMSPTEQIEKRKEHSFGEHGGPDVLRKSISSIQREPREEGNLKRKRSNNVVDCRSLFFQQKRVEAKLETRRLKGKHHTRSQNG